MPLIYALVGRGKTVLAEYTCAQGNFPTVTRILLAKIPSQDEEIKTRWRKQYSDSEQSAIAFAMNLSFSPVLKSQMDRFNNNPPEDSISRVQGQIDNVKNVMVDNIERVLERGEIMEILVDKTDRLGQQAFKFQKTAKTLKNAMYYKKMRIIAIGVFIGIGLIFVIAMMACGVKLNQC